MRISSLPSTNKKSEKLLSENVNFTNQEQSWQRGNVRPNCFGKMQILPALDGEWLTWAIQNNQHRWGPIIKCGCVNQGWSGHIKARCIFQFTNTSSSLPKTYSKVASLKHYQNNTKNVNSITYHCSSRTVGSAGNGWCGLGKPVLRNPCTRRIQK